MADNVPLSAGTADGATIATDDDGTAHHQYVKLEFGADNTQTKVADAAPLPVKISDGTDVALVSAGGALLVDASATTQPVSSATLGTAANQATIITSVQLIDDIVYTDDTSTHATGTSKGALIMAAATPTDTAVNANDIGAVGMTVDRKLHVAVMDALPAGTAAIGKLAANSGVDIGDVDILSIAAGDNNIGNVDIVTVPTDPFGANADAASATGSISAKLRFIAATGIPITGTVTVGSHAVTNAGTFLVQENGTHVQVDDAAFTPATSKIMMAGFEADEGSTDSVDEGDGGAARMTLDRKQIVTAQPHTAGGLSVANFTSQDTFTALTSTAQVIKASAGMLYGWYIYNPNSSAVYVHLYNVAAASVTVGTTTPLFPIVVPATSAANILGAVGIEFTNAGWSTAATTTGGGNTAPSTAVEATFFYK